MRWSTRFAASMPKSFAVVVVDTSVLVSAFLTAGPTKQVLALAGQGEFALCLSQHILAETSGSLRKPRLMAAYRHTAKSVDDFSAELTSFARMVPTCPRSSRCAVIRMTIMCWRRRWRQTPIASSPAMPTF